MVLLWEKRNGKIMTMFAKKPGPGPGSSSMKYKDGIDMDHKEMYQKKLTTAQEAVKVVRSGDWVDYGWCVGTPRALDKALAQRWQELDDVKIRGGVLFEVPATMQGEAEGHFTWNSWHMSGVERKMIDRGHTFFCPMRYSELPRFYRENVDPIKAMFVQVSPMDDQGCFTFGPSASHLAAVAERAEYIFVEVNQNMPRCLGGFENGIHISQVTGVIEGDNAPMWQLGGGGAPTAVDQAVADLIVPQIPNGACLQLGIGGMPNTVGAMIAQSDLKDLGVHTEMYVDGFVAMAEAGKITGRRKNFDKGRQAYAFAAGSQKLYDYLDNNPACMSVPVDYTNDVRVVAQLDNFISINNVIELDLFGQVAAETAGVRHISGAGGQLDFVMGAYLSKGGKSFLCCSSTAQAKDGTLTSRIRPTLPNGSVVTDTRANVQYLVTEYGMVNLKGTSTWERAERIISIAHPDFRDELIKEAEALKIWRKSNRR